MKKHFITVILVLFIKEVLAHPMPNTVVDLSILESSIKGVAKIPIFDLETAVAIQNINDITTTFFKSYFQEHILAVSQKQNWATEIDSLKIITANDAIIGKYREALVFFHMIPPKTECLRNFTFNYDVIIHQVITHKAIIYVHQDWNNGITGEENAKEIGIVGLDIPSGKIVPLEVNLEKGSRWKGFATMFSLGMHHIKEGTDHLLFLIVLLLPAMLLVQQKKWGSFGGTKYSLQRLIKIVTAFTIGHSITLGIGALGWLQLPTQPVEILIAFSILVSAIHAIYPIFPGKETYVAAVFGLVHGLAFASILMKLEMGAGTLALSILGFNLGIEVMQLFIIALTIPWLIVLSKTPFYEWIRPSFALLAAVAALAWIAERTSGKANFITGLVENFTQYGLWGIVSLALLSGLAFLLNKQKIEASKAILQDNG